MIRIRVVHVMLAVVCGCSLVPSPESIQKEWMVRDEQECEAGDGEACERLANRYRYGHDVARDSERAATFLGRACEWGNHKACNELGRMLAGSPGEHAEVRGDPAEARRLFEKLCDHGDPVGCYNVGVLYINGQGVPTDYDAAVPWLKKACTPSYRQGCETLDELERKKLVRQDLGRFAGGTPPGLMLSSSRAAYAAALRRWFPERIRVPVPYRTGEVPVSPTNLCRVSDVQVHPAGDDQILTGRLSVAPLPSGFRISARSAKQGAYRLLLTGFLVSKDGRVLWENELPLPAELWIGPGGSTQCNFSVMLPKSRGDSFLLVVSGDPVTVSAQDRGGAVILGTFLHPF